MNEENNLNEINNSVDNSLNKNENQININQENNNQLNNNISNQKNNKNTLKVILIVILTILLIAALSFIVYDKFINKDEVNSNTNTEENSNQGNNTQANDDKQNNNQENNNQQNIEENDNANNSSIVVDGNLQYMISDKEKDLIKNLTFPFSYVNWIGSSYGIVSPTNFNVSNMTKNDKMWFTLSLTDKYNESGESNPDCKDCTLTIGDEYYNTSINEEEVKKTYEKIFGYETPFENMDIDTKGGIPCYTPYKYDANTKRYWGNSSCGGDTCSMSFNIITKVEEGNDEIIVYFQSGIFNPCEEPAKIEMINYDKVLWTGTNNIDIVNSAIINLAKQNKLDTYKITFKKQSDGKYYVYSGEWQ